MPAAAVIPAPIAYIKVVAVKKLVVEFLAGRERSCIFAGTCSSSAILGLSLTDINLSVCTMSIVYCEQIRVFKAGLCR